MRTFILRTVSVWLLVVVGLSAPAYAQSTVTDRYDDTFKKYTKRFFGPGFDWRIFKAQGMAESNLNPEAKSGVGARGIMQLMSSTYKEVQSKNPDIGQIDDPEFNIAAGIYYNRQLWKQWGTEADEVHRQEFTFGSYNAGRTTLLRAQKAAKERALNERSWPSIQLVAPTVKAWRYTETLTYVDRIKANLLRMDPKGKVGKPSIIKK